jgi:hypothetical protein
MRTGITVHLSPIDRKRLRAIIDDRNSSQKHVWRARIVLATADGLGTVEIMRTAGVSKTAVWRWQERFMDEGVNGLLRDKTRPARVLKLADEVADRIVALTLEGPNGGPSGEYRSKGLLRRQSGSHQRYYVFPAFSVSGRGASSLSFR